MNLGKSLKLAASPGLAGLKRRGTVQMGSCFFKSFSSQPSLAAQELKVSTAPAPIQAFSLGSRFDE